MNFFTKKLTLIANIPVPGASGGGGGSGGSGIGGGGNTATSGGGSTSPQSLSRSPSNRTPVPGKSVSRERPFEARPPPPNPDFSNLTPDELDQLKKVLQKQEQFESEIEKSVSGLKRTMDYLINIQNRQNALQQSRSESSYETPFSPPPADSRMSKENFQQPWSASLTKSPKSPTAANVESSLSPKPVIATKVETPSSIASSSTFMSRFTSLKSLLDDGGEPAQSSSGFFSKFSSTSASSSTTSLVKQQLVCFICKKPLINAQAAPVPLSPAAIQPTSPGQTSSTLTVAPGGDAVPGKFKRWRKEMLVYNYSSSSTEKPQQIKPASTVSADVAIQCADCNNYACERCGNMTSPDFGGKDSATLSPNKDVRHWTR